MGTLAWQILVLPNHRLELYQQGIHILDSRQPTNWNLCTNNKIGMYPLAATGNLQWQWTFTRQSTSNLYRCLLSTVGSGPVFFPRHVNVCVKELGKAHIQTNPNGCKGIQTVYCRRKQTHCLGPTRLFGRKAKGWLDGFPFHPKGWFKIFDRKMVVFFFY